MKSCLLLVSLFCYTVSFAGSMTCVTRENPHSGRMQNQTPAPIPYAFGREASLSLKSIADPQIEFYAGGDDRGVEVVVKDLRTGISAQNMGDPQGVKVTLNMGVTGDYSLNCSIN